MRSIIPKRHLHSSTRISNYNNIQYHRCSSRTICIHNSEATKLEAFIQLGFMFLSSEKSIPFLKIIIIKQKKGILLDICNNSYAKRTGRLFSILTSFHNLSILVVAVCVCVCAMPYFVHHSPHFMPKKVSLASLQVLPRKQNSPLPCNPFQTPGSRSELTCACFHWWWRTVHILNIYKAFHLSAPACGDQGSSLSSETFHRCCRNGLFLQCQCYARESNDVFSLNAPSEVPVK